MKTFTTEQLAHLIENEDWTHTTSIEEDYDLAELCEDENGVSDEEGRTTVAWVMGGVAKVESALKSDPTIKIIYRAYCTYRNDEPNKVNLYDLDEGPEEVETWTLDGAKFDEDEEGDTHSIAETMDSYWGWEFATPKKEGATFKGWGRTHSHRGEFTIEEAEHYDYPF